MDYNTKLFLAVEKGHTANILTFLKQGAAINTRNKEWETTLIRAARLRKYVVMKILLAKGANPAVKDIRGLTALHLVASTGDVECIKLLLAHKAPLDPVDLEGFTPLHYAIDRGHLGAVDILLFCGADAYLKTLISPSPLKLAAGRGAIEDKVVDAIPALNGMKNKDVVVERKEFYSCQTYHFPTLELTVRTPRGIPDDSLSFLCRRVRPEYASRLLQPPKCHFLISDSFEFRIAHAFRNIEVELEIPLYDALDPFYEVVMKTDRCQSLDNKEPLNDIRRVPGKNLWVCCTSVVLGTFQSLILMTRPKMEKVKTGPTATHFRSEIDDFVEVVIPSGSFSSPGLLSSEIIPTPSYRHEDPLLSNLVTVGNLYSMSVTNKEPPSHQVTVTMPTPRDTSEEGTLVVVSTSLTDDDFYPDEGYGDENEDEESARFRAKTRLESWEILAEGLDIYSGKVEVQASHFSIFVPLQLKSGTDSRTTKEIADRVTEKGVKREKLIMFFAMVKPLGQNRFSLVVECVERKHYNSRMEEWKNKDYRPQEIESSAEFTSVSEREYVIRVVDRTQLDEGLAQFMAKVQMITGAKSLLLQFHQNRKNFQVFDVVLTSDDGLTNFYINISEKRPDSDPETLVELSMNLTGVPKEEKKKEFEDSGFVGFTCDALLWDLASKLGDEWVRVAIKLGLSFKTISKLTPNSSGTNLRQQKFKMLKKWRNMSKFRADDLGVPDLLVTFRHVGRHDLAQLIKERLVKWYDESEDKGDRFCSWIESMRREPAADETEGPAKPLSDVFLMALVERVGEPLGDMGDDLNLSPPEVERILNSEFVDQRQLQLLGMLSVACGKFQNKKMKFFKTLKAALVKHGQQDAADWMDSQAKQWLEDEADKQKIERAKRKSGEDVFYIELAEKYGLLESSEV